MHDNQYYKEAALSVLRGNWKPSIIATLVYLLIAGVISGVTYVDQTSSGLTFSANILSILVALPLGVGYFNAIKNHMNKESDDVLNDMFKIGFGNYKRNLCGMLLMTIMLVLWTLLLIVPGLIKSYAYMMTPYILNDNPELSVRDAIRKSEAMMKGHKFDLFYLHLSFVGWAILSLCTLGIGLLWLYPYMYGAQAAFYEDIKAAA
ncbi:MAG: DUF975 family protein [Bacteroidales bacterium]|nr:DUF975 family protein [Bacteroidales bacterium]